MLLQKCLKCGRVIHMTDSCYHCGNDTDFEKINLEIKVHENVELEYKALEDLICKENYKKATEYSWKVLEWEPRCSSVFWYRVLASYKCKDVQELLYKGFDCSNPDFLNALHLSSGVEKQVYVDLQEKMNVLKEKVKAIIDIRAREICSEQNILELPDSIELEFETYRDKMFDLWKKVEKIEQEISIMSEKVCVLEYEHKDALQRAEYTANRLKSNTSNIKRSTFGEFRKFQIQMGEIIYVSDYAKRQLDIIKDKHPWINKYKELVKQEREVIVQIKHESDSFEKYSLEIKNKYNDVKKWRETLRKAMMAAEQGDFDTVIKLYGEEIVMAAIIASEK